LSVLRYLGLIKSNPRQLSFLSRNKYQVTQESIANHHSNQIDFYGKDILRDGDTWGFRILFLRHFLFLGLADWSLNVPESSYPNTYHRLTFGWARLREERNPFQTLFEGNLPEWSGFQQGDEVTMMLCGSDLKMKIQRVPTETFARKIPADRQWRLFVKFGDVLDSFDSVELVKPFESIQ